MKELTELKLQILSVINAIPYFVFISLLIICVVLLFQKKKPTRVWWVDDEWPFYARQLLSQPEQVLYHRLVKALPAHIVFAQVQVSRVLGVKKGFNFHKWNNQINRLSYDFVVCNKDGSVAAAIELDDKSHESAERIATDKRKDKATTSAGIRMIRWHVKSMPDESTIKAAFTPLPIILDVKDTAKKVDIVFNIKI